MKKKILFVIPSLWSGGAEKSFITVLSLFDYEKYEVDLLAFRRDGLFADKLPKEINLIYNTEKYEMFDTGIKTSLKYFLKKADIFSAAERIKYSRLFGAPDDFERDKKIWKVLRKNLPVINKKYDCAIAYTENFACKFVCDEVNADRKICYLHTDLKTYEHNRDSFRDRFEKADRIVTVSENCRCSFCEEFPEMADKISVIENITSRKFIQAESESEDVYSERTSDETRILTVGRIVPVKNIGLAAEACAELKKRGRNVKWYHIGTGDLENELREKITELDIEDRFILLGERSNPYPYMAQCDIYVQPSKLEGKSIAIEEVKCLCRPLVVTDFSTAASQVNDGVDGFICKKNSCDMADKIEFLIDNPDVYKRFSETLKNESLGNEDEIYKLYSLIDDEGK